MEWRAKPEMERSDTAEADSLGLCGGRDEQDVECSGARNSATGWVTEKKVLTKKGQHKGF